MKKILFLTGTRADYGKIKSLMKKVDDTEKFELYIFVTGMHMLSRYGSTYKEIEKDGFKNIYKHINQKSDSNDNMDLILSNTIVGLSNYISEINPDIIIVHGDRLEAMAGAIVGSFNNIKVIHIEGGEISGTIDETIRHSITKLAHFHLVSNLEAKKRIIQLGEKEESVYVFGSPDLDIMYSEALPNLNSVKDWYEIEFDKYSILMYHPVTTESEFLKENIKEVVDSIIESNKNYVVIYPNNDKGSSIILEEYKRFEGNNKIKIFPSMKFEAFLTLLKNCDFIIGNSSSGIREASVYGKLAIDLGTRQKGRYSLDVNNILHSKECKKSILNLINISKNLELKCESNFGEGNSDELFIEILKNKKIWHSDIQKKFNDIDF